LALLLLLFVMSRSVAAEEKIRPSEAEMVNLMERHYEATILSHDALIQGDLETMRKQLARLARQKLPANAPQGWSPFHARLQEAARSGASNITTLQEAGSVMAEVAEACGACHAAQKVENIYYWPAPPEDEKSLKSTMHTHQWASERLWEGVTGPFAEAWPRGASALAEGRIFKGEGDEVKASLRAREDELREMGRSAMAASGLHARALAYGRLLTRCAACHREAGVSIAPAKPMPPWQE
jgi:cytochrome c553